MQKALHKLNSSAAVSIALVVLTGLVLRLIHLSQKSIVGDESSTVFLLFSTYKDIIQVVPGDFNPPLYNVFVKFWAGLFGQGEFVLRLSSVLFSTLTIFFVYRLGRLLQGATLGLAAAALVALLPLSIQYAQITRAYSVFALFFTLSLYLLLCLTQQSKAKLWFLWLVVSLLALHTHYLYIPLLGLSALFFLIWQRRNFQFVKGLLITSTLILLAFLPQLLIIWNVHLPALMSVRQPQSQLGVVLNLGFVVYGIFMGESLLPINPLVGFGILGSGLLALFLVGSIFKKRLLAFEWIALLIFVVYLAFIGVSGFARPMYIYPVLPVLMVVFARLILLAPKALQTVCALCLIVSFSISNFYWYTSNSYQILNSGLLLPIKEVSQTIKEKPAEHCVLLYPEWLFKSFLYYGVSEKTYALYNVERDLKPQAIQEFLTNKQCQTATVVAENYETRDTFLKLVDGLGFQIKSKTDHVKSLNLIDKIKGESESYDVSLVVIELSKS